MDYEGLQVIEHPAFVKPDGKHIRRFTTVVDGREYETVAVTFPEDVGNSMLADLDRKNALEYLLSLTRGESVEKLMSN